MNFKGSSDYNEIVLLLGDLIKIESINPDYSGGKNGESKICEYIYNYLTEAGVDCVKEEVLSGRSNVIGYIEGKDRRGLCFEAHVDTVSVDNMNIDPFDPIIKDECMFGRGSCDDKGSVAAMMYTMKFLKKNNIKPATDIYFVAAVDEEYKYRGVTHFLKKGIDLQGAVIGEPTRLNVVTAHKGVARWEITTHGKSGHSSRPEKGQNAIYDMMDIIYALRKDLIPALENKKHKLLDHPTLCVSKINGGVEVNIIPEKCTIEIDRRTLPGENWDSIKGEIANLIEKVKMNNKNINVTISEPSIIDYSMDTDIKDNIVNVSTKSSEKIIGKSKIEGVTFGTDASKFAKNKIPSIVLGPGNILQAHTAIEFVNLKEVCSASEIYSQICTDF